MLAFDEKSPNILDKMLQEITNTKNDKNAPFLKIEQEVAKVIVGNKSIIRSLIVGVLCQGHILLEGPPGVAKTTIIKALAKSLGLIFKRIQFTPDLLPSDVIGTVIFNSKNSNFEVRKGPIFANIILADEINRTPAKVQAALLEAMQEKQVTIGNETYKLDEPFIVFATQNPLENEGTYCLPEAQIDRFMMKLYIDYPSFYEEAEILRKNNTQSICKSVISHNDLISASLLVKQIHVSEEILNYIVEIVQATRKPEKIGLKNLDDIITYGASPRASISLYQAAQANAFLEGRSFVIPDDVKSIAPFIIAHRIGVNELESKNNLAIVRQILNKIKTP